MADDTSYGTFLAKANQDPKSGGSNEPQSTSQARSQYDPTTSSEALPASLRSLPSITYTSDTDSDFTPVFFSYAFDELPTTEQLGQVLSKKGIEGEIEELSVESFDPRGEYKEIVKRVKEASGSGEKGDGEQKGIKVFRVQILSTRVEYYILTIGDRKLVGVMTKAVES